MFKLRIPYILSAIIGVVFLISAITKIISVDSFEIYVYSFGLFNLNMAFILARILIGLELTLGACLLLSVYRKWVSISALGLLAGFTLLLLYLLIRGESEHCHCFGDIIPLSHIPSIIKNLLLAAGLVYLLKTPAHVCRIHKIILPLFLLVGLALPFIISPPDTFQSQNLKEESYHPEYLQSYLGTHPDLKQGHKVICFMGPGCRFCKLTAKKMSVIAQKVGKTEDVFYVMWGDSTSVEDFFQETHSFHFPFSTIDGSAFLRITDGKMPLIMMLNEGKVIQTYNYRSMKEQEILDFLKTQNP